MPTDPTPEAYEAADRAYDAVHDIDLNLYDNRTPHDEALSAVIDAVWKIAEATVRAKVAAEIRAWAAQIAVRAEVLAGAPTGAADEHPVTMGFEMAARIAEGSTDE